MNESVSNRPGKRRVFYAIAAAIVVLLVLIGVFCTCTDTGRMIRKVGIPYQVAWSFEPEGYGYALYICQTNDDMVACALKKRSSKKDGVTTASVDRGEELQMMHSYAENGKPKTEMLYLYLVKDRSYEHEGIKEYDHKGLTHYTFQLVDNKLVILCITETNQYNSEELRQIGLDEFERGFNSGLASCSSTPVLLGDEPTGNLEGENRRVVMDILRRLVHEEGRCVIVATHAPEAADKVLRMKDGVLTAV